jgi:cell division protein FtsA
LSKKDDDIDITELMREEELGDETEIISRKYVAEIIEARVEEIMERIDGELKKIERSGMLPAGVFFIGGGAKLHGLVEVAKQKLRLPASIGTNRSPISTIDKVDDPAYLTSLGLVIWHNQFLRSNSSKRFFGNSVSSTFGSGLQMVGGWFRKLVP